MQSRDGWECLHERLAAAMRSRGWSPTPVQEVAMEPILSGSDALVVAPTGSGKTEAAVLPLASLALDSAWSPLAILYVTPLRALNRDIERRLPELLGEVGLSVGLRHGDTTQSERARQSRKPPHLLITTPETLQIMLLGSRLRTHLAGLRAVIVDEVHDLAASERGSQLLLGLARIDILAGRRIQRIGLSATVGDPTEVARWLAPDAIPIVAAAPRKTEILVASPLPTRDDELVALDWRTDASEIAAFRHLSASLDANHPALVFVNSRSQAETVAQRLASLAPELNIGVHHGSLARETREAVEKSLVAGELHALICTSSMELGIDVGSIKRVHQLQSPRAVDKMLQRVGRADHFLGGIGKGDILAWEVDQIAESAVIARRAMAGELEPVEWRVTPRTVAANQLILLSVQQGIVRLEEATLLLKSSHLFEDWTDADTLGLLRVLADRWMLRLVENIEDSDPINWPKSLWQQIAETKAGIEAEMPIERVSHEAAATLDADLLDKWRATARRNVPEELSGGWYSPSARGIKMRQEGLSMIPDALRYRVRDAVTRSVIGSLDERFVLSISGAEDDDDAGLFVMAGRVWAVIDVNQDDSELLVSPGSAKADAPHWDGELPPVPKEIAHEVGRLRLAILDEIRSGPADPSNPDFQEQPPNSANTADLRRSRIGIGSRDLRGSSDLQESSGKGKADSKPLSSAVETLDGEAYNRLANAVAEHYDAAECIPHATLFTIEQRADALVINTCQGSRINETLAHFLQAMGSTIEGRMGRALVDAYRVVLQVPGLDIGKAQEFLNNTPPSSIEGIMRVTVPNSRALRWRLAHVCRVMGVLRRGVDPRRVSLAGIIRRYRGTAVVDDALDKLFHERMDLDGCADVLRDIQSGTIEVRASAPGPLGTSPRNRRDMLLPEFSDDEVLERLEKRLLDERMVQICLRCSSLSRRRVARFSEAERRCTCGGAMLAAAIERGEKRLKDSVSSVDEKDRTRMIRNAELVRQYGLEAILCLVGRGIAEDTAAKILRATPPKDRPALLRAIHKAEMQYARTRRFW